MSKETPEELINGVRQICDHYCSRGTPDAAIEETIARIGKAYADGELELPGEVGRGTVYIPDGWTWDRLPELAEYGYYRRFIAFRDEEIGK